MHLSSSLGVAVETNIPDIVKEDSGLQPYVLPTQLNPNSDIHRKPPFWSPFLRHESRGSRTTSTAFASNYTHLQFTGLLDLDHHRVALRLMRRVFYLAQDSSRICEHDTNLKKLSCIVPRVTVTYHRFVACCSNLRRSTRAAKITRTTKPAAIIKAEEKPGTTEMLAKQKVFNVKMVAFLDAAYQEFVDAPVKKDFHEDFRKRFRSTFKEGEDILDKAIFKWFSNTQSERTKPNPILKMLKKLKSVPERRNQLELTLKPLLEGIQKFCEVNFKAEFSAEDTETSFQLHLTSNDSPSSTLEPDRNLVTPRETLLVGKSEGQDHASKIRDESERERVVNQSLGETEFDIGELDDAANLVEGDIEMSVEISPHNRSRQNFHSPSLNSEEEDVIALPPDPRGPNRERPAPVDSEEEGEIVSPPQRPGPKRGAVVSSDEEIESPPQRPGQKRGAVVSSDEEIESPPQRPGQKRGAVVSSDEEIESPPQRPGQKRGAVVSSDEEIESPPQRLGPKRRAVVSSDEVIEAPPQRPTQKRPAEVGSDEEDTALHPHRPEKRSADSDSDEDSDTGHETLRCAKKFRKHIPKLASPIWRSDGDRDEIAQGPKKRSLAPVDSDEEKDAAESSKCEQKKETPLPRRTKEKKLQSAVSNVKTTARRKAKSTQPQSNLITYKNQKLRKYCEDDIWWCYCSKTPSGHPFTSLNGLRRHAKKCYCVAKPAKDSVT
ncbi:hypothetical protein BDP27DRAFT_1369002 [Rhodocollybia butyracea]|uniref:Uncharacterized protein n=1 Tax=Rhodocollybia butyracea TaxID=206335 RepID=A0A9P5U052_9AGAR|nr:hypothetical protein BDP27DRAFT_1369002 [Rhodocollybia butyracea]